LDGGLADNLPVFPLVSIEQCDELFVIRLRPHQEGDLEKSWQIIDRKFRVADIPDGQRREMYYEALKRRRGSTSIDEQFQPPIVVRYRKCVNWPKKIAVIAPQKKLGNFLSGTINFRSSYTKRLIKMGYHDTLNVIS